MLVLSLPHGPALVGYPGVGVALGVPSSFSGGFGSRQSGKVLPLAQSLCLICTSASLVGDKVASTLSRFAFASYGNVTCVC